MCMMHAARPYTPPPRSCCGVHPSPVLLTVGGSYLTVGPRRQVTESKRAQACTQPFGALEEAEGALLLEVGNVKAAEPLGAATRSCMREPWPTRALAGMRVNMVMKGDAADERALPAVQPPVDVVLRAFRGWQVRSSGDYGDQRWWQDIFSCR